jgi:nucleotide-binding universal stress UspA family protein
MVTGYNGVKGPKADPTIAGSAIQYLAVNSTLPVLVIKDARTRAQKPLGLYRYGVCYDGSPQSKKALECAIKMMRKGDRLTTITVKEPNVDDDKTDVMVKQMMADCEQTGAYDHVSLEHSMTETVYNTIKNYLKA